VSVTYGLNLKIMSTSRCHVCHNTLQTYTLLADNVDRRSVFGVFKSHTIRLILYRLIWRERERERERPIVMLAFGLWRARRV
jgi:hypothetical protein